MTSIRECSKMDSLTGRELLNTLMAKFTKDFLRMECLFNRLTIITENLGAFK